MAGKSNGKNRAKNAGKPQRAALVAAATTALERAAEVIGDDEPTSAYLVQRPVLHHADTYSAGEEIDLTDDEAGHLLATGAIVAIVEVVEPEVEPAA